MNSHKNPTIKPINNSYMNLENNKQAAIFGCQIDFSYCRKISIKIQQVRAIGKNARQSCSANKWKIKEKILLPRLWVAIEMCIFCWVWLVHQTNGSNNNKNDWKSCKRFHVLFNNFRLEKSMELKRKKAPLLHCMIFANLRGLRARRQPLQL